MSRELPRPCVLVVIGPAASGKTTIGAALAARLGWHFVDADDHHPPANVARMRAGLPLGDAERGPWLDRLRALLAQSLATGRPLVLACSALRRAYRRRLLPEDAPPRAVVFVQLVVAADRLAARIAARAGHFFGAGLLPSQLAELEPPDADEPALAIDANPAPECVVENIVARLAALPGAASSDPRPAAAGGASPSAALGAAAGHDRAQERRTVTTHDSTPAAATPLPHRMRYVAARSPGEADVLQVETAELPRPRAHEVLVRVLAAGVNRPDVLQRRGAYPPPPEANPVLGLEVAGEVVAAGADVTTLRGGERVCALTNGGGYAEYCTVPAVQCLPWPTGYDALRAAALPETYFTVWANLFQQGGLARGETVLVHGGTGGIGTTAIQLAQEFGAQVYATAGSAEKCAACVRLGATAAIDYRAEDFAERLAALTAGRGVDVVLDVVGAPYFERNLKSLALDGRLVVIAVMGGAKVERFDLSFVMRRRLVVTGSTMRPRTTIEKGAIARALRETVWPVLNAGRAGPVLHEVFPLERAADAHRLMESSRHVGKIVLRVAET